MNEATTTRRRALLPQPYLSALLLAAWLLAQNAVSPGYLVLGVLLAVAVPLVTQRFWPEYPRTLRLLPLARLAAVVLFDIAVANLRVARLILGPKRRLRPAFFSLPVTLREPFPVTVLASIISLTPGTVSADLSPDRRTILIHGLDVVDVHDAIATIRARYERPLQEVFE